MVVNGESLDLRCKLIICNIRGLSSYDNIWMDRDGDVICMLNALVNYTDMRAYIFAHTKAGLPLN